MKASNKRRLEALEQANPVSTSPVVIIYDPASPPPKDSNTSTNLRIFIPDNGRQSAYNKKVVAVFETSESVLALEMDKRSDNNFIDDQKFL